MTFSILVAFVALVAFQQHVSATGNLKNVYNVVVLGNTGVGKSALLNMFAGEDLFKVGDSAMSETSIAASHLHRFMGKPDGIQLRLIDTQGLSDTGGDSKDMAHIKNMVEYIKQLQEIDMFIICFDGTNPRFTAYAQSTISLFSQIFPDFLYHSVIVFNKWATPDKNRMTNLKREYQAKINSDYGLANIPCYFIDSYFNRKMLRDNEDGTESERFLHPNTQARTLAQVIELMNFLVLKGTTCDVRKIEPKETELSALQNANEEQKKELEAKKLEFEKNMKELKEQNDNRYQESLELTQKEMRELRAQMEKNKGNNGNVLADLVNLFAPFLLSAAFGK